MKLKDAFKNRITFYINDTGSVMVTVLIAFFFVSVLVAIIMSTAVVNFKMRGIDRKTKDEFYYAEKTLEDIYNGLGKDCSQFMGDAYNEVLTDYEVVHGRREEDAYAKFVQKFISKFRANIHKSSEDDFKAVLSGYVVKNATTSSGNKTARAILTDIGEVTYYSDIERTTKITSFDPDEIKKIRCIVIKDVNVSSNPEATETQEYVSEVSVDIVIDVPKVSFFTLNNDIYNYAILASEGLEFQENSKVTINGSTYGGTLDPGKIGKMTTGEPKDYGGIYVGSDADVTIDDAKYVVSGGDIIVDSGDLTINPGTDNGTNIWFESLDVKGKEADVNITGDLYAANDLEIDADDSTVTISGGYYGYNDGNLQMKTSNKLVEAISNSKFLTTKEALLRKAVDKSAGKTYNSSGSDGEDPSSKSSSIIINGQNNILDMSNLNTLLLMGSAYVNHASKANVEVIDGKIADNSIQESVSYKTMQALMLMPSEFIKDVSNPALLKNEGDKPFDGKVTIPSNWFGEGYLSSRKYKTVTVKRNSQNYSYCYLDFENSAKKFDYLNAVMAGGDSGASPTAKTMKRGIEILSKDYGNDITVGHEAGAGSDATRIYVNSPIVEYDKDHETISVKGNDTNASAKIYSNYIENMYRRYRLLDTYMEPMEDKPLSVPVNAISYQDLVNKNEELPTARFFWMAGVRGATNGTFNPEADGYNVSGNTAGIFVSKEIAGSRLVILRSSGPRVDLSQIRTEDGNDLMFQGSNTNAFVIIDAANGSFVPSGKKVVINGFLISKGKIVVETGGELDVSYNSTLINRRVNYELKELASDKKGYDDTSYEGSVNSIDYTGNKRNDNTDGKYKGYLIYYLLNTSLEDERIYNKNVTENGELVYQLKGLSHEVKNTSSKGYITDYRMYQEGASSKTAKVNLNTNYKDFVYYENWKKGQH